MFKAIGKWCVIAIAATMLIVSNLLEDFADYCKRK